MRKILLGLILLSSTVGATEYFLPEDFVIYTDGNMTLDWQPDLSFVERQLPTFNHYEGEDGGYIAIYTNNEDAGVYSVGDGIYVVGQIRLEGHYEERIFVPIMQTSQLLAVCNLYFSNEIDQIWFGGDTGGWFGIE